MQAFLTVDLQYIMDQIYGLFQSLYMVGPYSYYSLANRT